MVYQGSQRLGKIKFPDFSLTFPGLQNSLTIPGFLGLWEPCLFLKKLSK